MDERSVLCGFEAQVAAKGIETRVEKLPDEKSVHSSRLAYAAEDTPLMFSVKPGSLEVGEILTAKFSSVTQLNFTEGEIELLLPSLKKQSATIKITKFEISFAMSRVILGVYSTSHTVQFVNAEERVGTATIAVDDSKAFTDLFMTIDVDEALPLVTVQEEEDTGTKVAMVSYQPPLDTFGDTLAEVIFMIDRSGSMDKFGRLDDVKKLLPSLFAKLPPNALFNVFGFGAAFESVFRDSKEIGVSSVEEAYNALLPWEADLGQTQLFGALTAILTNPVKEGYVRHIVIISDGEVEDLELVSSAVQRHVSTTTFSVIRIGKDSIENFPRTIARLGRGSCAFVTDEHYADLAEKSKELLDEILRPYISNVSVSWDGLVDDFAPFKPAPIRKGDSITAFGFVQEGSEDGAVKISGITSKGPFNIRIPVANSMTATGVSVHRLAANFFVRDLEVDQSTYPASWMIMTGTRDQALADKVWEVSVWNNVPSSVSTFACFQETEDIMLEQTPLPVSYGFVYDHDEKEEAPVNNNIGGSGNFWATFGFSSESVLDKLLDSGEYTLEQLLAEDDLFSEAQSSNEQLVKFLNKPRALRKVFNYVSQPSVLKDDPSWHYVYLCTELLALPIWDKALDAVYAPGCQCMEKLVSVLVMPDADEQRIFRACRVFASFMGYSIDRLIDFFKTQKELIPALVRHLKTSFIVDLIKALLKPDNGPKRAEILEWLFSGGFFDEVIAQLSPSSSTLVQDNASDILISLMNAAGEVTLQNRPYESGATIDKIFAVMFDKDLNPTLSFRRGLDVLNGVVGILEIPKRLNPDDQGPPPTHPTLLLILPHLDKFKKLLTAPTKTRIGTFGEITIAGELAVTTLRFLLGLVRPRSLHVDNKLIELDILTDCINMFFRFNLNNFVHTAVEKLFVNILSTYREDPSLKIALLKKTDLPLRLVEGYRKAKSKTEQGYNMGHSSWGGHLYRIAVALVAERYNANISQILDEHTLWMEFEKDDFVKEQKLYAGWDAAPPKRV